MTDEPEAGPEPDPNVAAGPVDSSQAAGQAGSADQGEQDDGQPIEKPAPTDHGKTPFHFVRALLLTMPLAILVGSVVAPPDPVAQVVLIGGTLVGGLPITYRLVANRRFGPRQLGGFFGIVLVVTLVGLWLLEAVGSGPIPDILLRFGIVVVSLFVADLLVFRYLGFEDG